MSNFRCPLITGGAGFIGSEMVRRFAVDDSIKKIFVIDKLTYAGDLLRIQSELNSGKVELIESDVRETKNYKNVFREVDSVFHFAAETHVDRSIQSGEIFYQSNVLGTYNLLDLVRNSGVIRTIVVSTDEVYGSTEIGEFVETDRIDASSPYSASKAAAELVAIAQFKTFGQDVLITRCPNNYGKFQDGEKFIPTVIRRALNNQDIPIYGTGMNVREWIHISDHIDALITIFKQGQTGGIINIGSGDRFNNLELAQKIQSMIPDSISKLCFVKDRPGHDFRYAVDSSKLRKSFRWTPKITFHEGLKELIMSERAL